MLRVSAPATQAAFANATFVAEPCARTIIVSHQERLTVINRALEGSTT
ncbi:MAG: hypothetical protein KGL52_00415 [Rhodospirillales bacterium]|nr:hypothetical protein [Rhodospirillales bacterium]